MEKQARIKFYVLSILLAGLMGCTVKNQKVGGKADNVGKVTVDSTKMHEEKDTLSEMEDDAKKVVYIPSIDDKEDREETKPMTEEEKKIEEIINRGGLNGIRFDGWTEKQFLNNKYIRTLRKHIDAYLRGKVKEAELDPYREKIRCKFAILSSVPYQGGGLYISFVFLNIPETVFESWVYSSVDYDTFRISDYEVQSIDVSKEKGTLTKEDILQLKKKDPSYKLW